MHFSYRLTITFLLLTFLLEGHYINATDTEQKHPSSQETLNIGLMRAIRNGDIDKVKHLIAEGADINTKNDIDERPLHYAIKSNYNTKQKDGKLIPIEFHHLTSPDIIKTLIEAKADIHATNNFGGTPLHYASFFGHEEAISLLVEAGANANARDNNGDAPLHLARNTRIIVKLIDSKAFMYMKNKRGFMPIHTARDKEILDILRCYHVLTRYTKPRIIH